jgi:predicted metal-dependent phosphoesterase TrpH
MARPPKKLKVDLHTHSWFSHDSLVRPPQFVEACLKKGINCVAVTDHNEIDGAKAIQRIAPFKVIVGEEIRTSDGEIIGLFLKKRIPPNLSAEETIQRIREQKGLVYVPHPFAAGVVMRLKKKVLERVIKQVDIIEGWNSRGILVRNDRAAQAFAKKHGLPFAAGSDAHQRFEIGSAYIEMEDFRSRKEFLRNLMNGRLVGRKTHLLATTASALIGRVKVLAGHRDEWARQERTGGIVIRNLHQD